MFHRQFQLSNHRPLVVSGFREYLPVLKARLDQRDFQNANSRIAYVSVPFILDRPGLPADANLMSAGVRMSVRE